MLAPTDVYPINLAVQQGANLRYARALDAAVEAAHAAAEVLRAECARPEGPRGKIGHCPADDAAEGIIREMLTTGFPEWGYRGEETRPHLPASADGHVWLVDPNDGTMAMQEGFRGHAVSIALLRDAVPVLGVVLAVDAPDDDGDLITWAEACGPVQRNGVPVERAPWPDTLGHQDVVLVSQAADWSPKANLACVMPGRFISVASIAYRLALVAVGEGAAGVSLSGPGDWDYAAGHALLRGAGGVLLNEHGQEVTYTRDGVSNTRRCFGGGLAVSRELAGREWAAVLRSSDAPFGLATPPLAYLPARLHPGSLIHDAGVLRRAHGCVLGQLAGDTLGSLVEFQGPGEIARRYPEGGPRVLAAGGSWNTMAGQPTDDSELALLLARTLVSEQGFDQEATAFAYGRWHNGWTHEDGPTACEHAWCEPFDEGTTTAAALGAITSESVRRRGAARAAMHAARHDSQANGGLMRVSPIGIWGTYRDQPEVAEAARRDAQITHPNPVCQDASAIFAVTIAWAIRTGADRQATYDHALQWAREHGCQQTVVQAVADAAVGPPPSYTTQEGWVLIALRNAFYRLLHAPTFEEAVVQTVRSGGDTDTNAAICGALVGAVNGREAVPAQWRRMVLSCRPFPGAPEVEHPRPAMLWPSDALVLAERLLVAGRTDTGAAPGG
ncbi:MAG: ADP-ribosylglycohydrolase family protein [Chloroflexi bacterium]|nr:ADP-ribosylglycohydrolase family protein [Chloroflexota bacterium]